jgi:hypothetical protein
MDPNNQPVTIQDAVAMFRKQIGSNEYTTVYVPDGIINKVIDIINENIPLSMVCGRKVEESPHPKGMVKFYFTLGEYTFFTMENNPVKTFNVIQILISYFVGYIPDEIPKFFEDYFIHSSFFDGSKTCISSSSRELKISDLKINCFWQYIPHIHK